MDTSNLNLLKQALSFAKNYFIESEDRAKAWALFLGAVLLVFALVGLSFALSWWSMGFWTAIMTKDVALFLFNTAVFTGLIAGYTVVSVLKNYCLDVLALRWRKWLTEHLIHEYLNEHRYLNLARVMPEIDNPAQRIQEDVETFVSASLSLTLDFLNSTLMLAVFSGTLWVLGGALTVTLLGASLTIPGYLFWCAILFSLTGSFIMHKIGKRFAQNTNEQKTLEADLRKKVDFVQSESENIAQQKGESYHKQTLMSNVKDIVAKNYEKVLIRMRLIGFEEFFLQAAMMFPTLVMAPLFFKDKISIGQFTQAGNAFIQVQLSMSWFMTAYETFANYTTSIKRLHELKVALQSKKISPHIQIKENTTANEVKIDLLNITKPASTQVIMKNLNLKFNRGENTLIRGGSGLGKSTLFKALGGTWQYGEGNINMPNTREAFFLSQKPLLPEDTLKAVLAYPEPVLAYTNEQYQYVLRLVGGLEHLIPNLDQKSAWSRRLSGGEQQRLAFARAFLKKPKWLFLDEISASLDIQSEQQLYRLIKEHLKETTFISIAHRPSVAEFHDRIISIEKDTTGRVKLKEERLLEQVAASNDEALEHCDTTIRMC